MAAVPNPPSDPAPRWDALPGMVLLLRRDGAAVYANAAFLAFSGLPAEQVAGTGWLAALLDESRTALRDALTARADFALQLRLPRAHGGMGWVECAARWQTSGPDDGHCLCLLQDVSAVISAQVATQARATLFRLLADNVPVLIAYYERDGWRCRFANKQYANTFGLDERSILGRSVSEIIGAEATAQIRPYIDEVLSERRTATYERQLRGADGAPRWIEVTLVPHFSDDGTVIAAFVLISDITKHRLAERATRESEERLAKFMLASAEGIVFHRDGVITDANPPICQLTGFAFDEIVGRRTLEFIAPDQVGKVTAVMLSGQETSYESVLIDKRGQRIPVEFIVRTMLRNGESMRMTIVRDIRDRHAVQARIHHLAHHDALTGLPNRMSFMERLEPLVVGALAGESRLALLFIDLDHFKRVNDSLGHLVGDTLLRVVAQRITSCLRATDVVARFGGDEFVVLLPGMSAAQRGDVEEVAQKLLAAIGVEVDAEGRPITVTPSIGIALFPGDGVSPDELVKHADSAMYLAKARGRANYQFFDPGMASSAYAALVVEGQLSQALVRGEFELYFQPQVRARDGLVIGAEALMRWNHPQRGLLTPDEFIPVAEQQRLMLPIGAWVMKEAVRCAQRWHSMGLGVELIAVNLSTVQFQSAGFVETVADLLPPGVGRLIELELTERMLMDDLPAVKAKLEQLKALGLRISVDDFGTGYSSLGHLKALPIDKLKIDRSFIHDLPEERDSAAIARAIIQMGLSLGMTVIAEGVETEAQRHFLASHGCDELQGTLVSAPLSVAAFEAWVAARTPASPA
jgi:diguanylate cyclase (GGDEF)-like protein/PAS domain S-box-containing protein